MSNRNKALPVKSNTMPWTPVGNAVLQRKCACGNHATGGVCEECAKKKGMLQRKPQHTGITTQDSETVPPIVHEVLRSPGHPLDPATRAFMEPRFGHDFSGVRVHTDAKAAESARAVNAQAYTVGSDVVFAVRQYAPGTFEGRRLLAHELTHTKQQSSGQISNLVVRTVDDSSEKEAAQMATVVTSSKSSLPGYFAASRSVGSQLQRQLTPIPEAPRSTPPLAGPYYPGYPPAPRPPDAQAAKEGEIRASAWGLASDTEIRDWIRRENLIAIGQIPLAEKLRLMNRLLDGWVSDDDLDAIDKICRSVTSTREMARIRAAIEPRAIDLTDLGQRTRLRIILSRTTQAGETAQVIPPAPTPSATKAPGEPSPSIGASKLEFYHGTRWSIAKQIPKNVKPMGGGDFAAGFYTHHDDDNKKALKRAVDWGKLLANRRPPEPYAGVVDFRVPEREYHKLLVNSKEFNLRYLDQPDYKERQKQWLNFVTAHGRVAEPTFHADRAQWIHERREPQPQLPYNIVKGPFYTPLRGTSERKPKPEEFQPYALGKKVPHQVTWANEGLKLLNSDLVDTELMQYDAKTGKRQDPPVDTASSQAPLTPKELAEATEEAQFAMTE